MNIQFYNNKTYCLIKIYFLKLQKRVFILHNFIIIHIFTFIILKYLQQQRIA